MEEESKWVRVVVGMRGPQIGSRPPRCERLCSSCGHCEAVQVPVSPQVLLHQNDNRSRRRRSQISRFSFKNNNNNNNVAYSRGDDVSNYKPTSWKCKCGDFLFNPWLWFSSSIPCFSICLFSESMIHIYIYILYES